MKRSALVVELDQIESDMRGIGRATSTHMRLTARRKEILKLLDREREVAADETRHAHATLNTSAATSRA